MGCGLCVYGGHRDAAIGAFGGAAEGAGEGAAAGVAGGTAVGAPVGEAAGVVEVARYASAIYNYSI